MQKYKFLILVAILSYWGCVEYFKDPVFPTQKINFFGKEMYFIERYVVSNKILDPITYIDKNQFLNINSIMRPYYDTIIENGRPESLHFKKEFVTIEEYANGHIKDTMDFHYTNNPYDIKIYHTDPLDPVYYGGLLDDTTKLDFHMLFILKDKKPLLKNILSSVYITDPDRKENFVENAIDKFNLNIGDTIYLQSVRLKFAKH